MLRTRVLSAAALVPVVLVALWLDSPFLQLLILLIAALAAHEAFVLLQKAGYVNEPLLGTAIALVAIAGAWLFADRASVPALFVALGIVIAAIAAFLRPDPFAGLQAWAATSFGAVYVGLLGFLVLIIETAGPLPAGAPLAGWLDGGRIWLVIAILAVWSFDSGAYLVGRRFGKTHFIPHLSPGKTLEGVIGGIVVATLVTAVTLWLAGQNPLGALLLGPLISVVAQAGDLAESMLKRAAGVKDSGSLIPGHGGMLDRVDSILFAAPAAYFYILVLGSFR
ncbi:MAG: phosphatidate cytidylyltransferase [Candidatus Limnocylindrales bacterium]